MGAMKDEAIRLGEQQGQKSVCPDCGVPSSNGEQCPHCQEASYWDRQGFDDLNPSDDGEKWE